MLDIVEGLLNTYIKEMKILVGDLTDGELELLTKQFFKSPSLSRGRALIEELRAGPKPP